MVRWITTLGSACIVALLVLGSCKQPASAPPALPGNPAPPFTLPDSNGRTVTLANLTGKAVVLDFWATWCGPCGDAVRELEDLHRSYRDRGVVVIGISVNKEGDAAARVRAFAAARGMSYLLLIDDGSAYKGYGVTRIPATFVLDRDHRIRESYPGFRPGIGKEIAAKLDAILASP